MKAIFLIIFFSYFRIKNRIEKNSKEDLKFGLISLNFYVFNNLKCNLKYKIIIKLSFF
jgi:hypothetical protein